MPIESNMFQVVNYKHRCVTNYLIMAFPCYWKQQLYFVPCVLFTKTQLLGYITLRHLVGNFTLTLWRLLNCAMFLNICVPGCVWKFPQNEIQRPRFGLPEQSSRVVAISGCSIYLHHSSSGLDSDEILSFHICSVPYVICMCERTPHHFPDSEVWGFLFDLFKFKIKE